MPLYHTIGNIPHKRHTIFKNGKGLMYAEELVGSHGFSGISSLVYHLNSPTKVKEVYDPVPLNTKIAISTNLKSLSFQGFMLETVNDYLESRKILLLNNDIMIGLATPGFSMDYFYKNAEGDELFFIHEGSGYVQTLYGRIDFGYGDYVIIPKGTIYKINFKNKNNRILFIESKSQIMIPKKYRNEFGQLLEHAPFCERDIRKPHTLETHLDEKGEFLVKIKKGGMIHNFVYENHPFDVVGWDGYHYPWSISIFDFEPIVGRVHQPPPVHQTFEGNNFVICSFVPRLFDFHPEAVPAPYNHSNIDSDEVIYYVDGDFMSRNNIRKGQITLHPSGIPHGPQPGAVERSIGKKETKELAVMIDPFNPLMVTEDAIKIEVKEYYKSWIEQN